MPYLSGFKAEGNHLRNRFNTIWATTTPIAWGNTKFTPPSSSAWVRFSVTHSGSDRASTGPQPIQRYDGMVIIEIFVPSAGGEGEIDTLVDTAADIFRDYRSQMGLRFGTPWPSTVGPTDGSWFKKDVLCPFQRDTIHS